MDISNIQENLHLKDYLNILARRRGIALLFYSMVMLFVTIGTIVTTPVFRSTATLLIDMEGPNVLATSGSVSLGSRDYFAYKEYFQTQSEIIRSQDLLKHIFDEFKLSDSKDYKANKEQLTRFMETVEVEPVRDSRLLKINVENEDPVLATNIVNRIAEIYVKQNLYFITKDELTNLIKNEYLQLEQKLSEYGKIYKYKHPKMIRLENEMAGMMVKIEKLKEVTLNYNEDIDDIQQKYSHALQGFKANNVRILSKADVPITHIKPKKRVNLFLAFIIGVFGGIGLAFFFEYLDDTLQGIIDLKKLVKWPFLGSVPKIEAAGKRRRCLFTHTKPADPVSEAYRAIRTSILFSSPKRHPYKTMLVTSPGPEEGKTTTICNLAITLAHSKKKVLLVDADMRKPRLFSVFKKSVDVGLSTYLSGETEPDDIIQQTEVENLFLATSGPIVPDTAELLSTDKMQEFIDKYKTEFDFILFDCPPIPIVTDAIILSRHVDGIVLVVQKGITSRRILRHVSQLLSESKTKVIGTILNKSPITAGSNSYYYYAKNKP